MAAEDIYINPGTTLLFADSAQTPDANLTLSALASAAGRISARYDRGAGAQPFLYEWRASVQPTGTLVVDQTVDWYLSTSDGTYEDGDEGTADADLVDHPESLRNMHYMGSCVVQDTVSLTRCTASGTVLIASRYFSVVCYNNTGNALETSTANHSFYLTPIPYAKQ